MLNELQSSSIAPGTLIARKYRLLYKVGEGAMGAVWAAKNEITSGDVALKLLHLPDTELRQRLHREARAGALLKHRHILDVYDMGETATGEPFLVMQLLSGETLSALLKQKRRLDPPIAALIGRDIARALSAAHAVKIVHRDLKPANVFLHHEPGEDEPVVKVLDFGVAKDLASSDSLRTAFGSVVGSLYYMSPEQARAQPDIDHRADIWSLGVVLFEMLAGVRPFQGDSNEVFANVLNGEIPSVSKYVRRVDEGLVQIVAGCLRRNRDERYRSAAEVAKLLNGFADGGELARPPAEPARGPLASQPDSTAVLETDGPTVLLPPREARPPAPAAPAPAGTTTVPLPSADPARMPVRGGTIQLSDAMAAQVRAAVKQAKEAAELGAAGRSSTEPMVKAAEAESVDGDARAGGAPGDTAKNGTRGRKALIAGATGIFLGAGLCVAGVTVPMAPWGKQTAPTATTLATATAPMEVPPPSEPLQTTVATAQPSATPTAAPPEPAASATTTATVTSTTPSVPPPAAARPVEKDPCAEMTGLLLRNCRNQRARKLATDTYEQPKTDEPY